MFVCVYVYVCVCVCVCVCVRVCACVRVFVNKDHKGNELFGGTNIVQYYSVPYHVSARVHMYVHVRACVCVRRHLFVCAHVRVYVVCKGALSANCKFERTNNLEIIEIVIERLRL